MTLPMQRPRCPKHGCYMEIVPVELQTSTQRWCGIWYECPRACYNSVLFSSRELRAQLEEQAEHQAQQEMFA